MQHDNCYICDRCGNKGIADEKLGRPIGWRKYFDVSWLCIDCAADFEALYADFIRKQNGKRKDGE